ncbi:site-specific DNA-methyltransferase [Facklamia lactis]|uniref:site-specific DNA-methyltransferase n=1 Tax=Facklamia lactis TaxID=2749967 RepID=UPI0018CE13D3|nr:site-specific DNA-methyltransferase [Facklamia lactis]MBG9980473.1 site-specific DNA-methyltransferase [Facklamia lactis]
MNTKIMNALNDILSSFGDKYYIGDELNKAKVIQDIDSYDEELIMALLSNDLVEKHYARKIGEYTLIETNKLIETFEMDNYWMNSYTKYSKKIGLTVNGRFLDESTDVVLGFPYKDTVLKAGMSKEDVEKEDLLPNEPFYNEVVAAEEIDTLLDKKVLVNAKRHTPEGIEEVVDFTEEDNLILKGNNLLALHSLKETHAGKVKLIYIDPPFNTEGDTFEYNDYFNHSTWLTFMKNRLEIAHALLASDGLILIHLDFNEVHYLKILADEIFGRKNFLNEIIWCYRERETSKRFFNRKHDTILFYAKDKESNYTFNNELIREEYSPVTLKKFKYTDEEGRKYRLRTKDGKSDPAKEDDNSYRQYLDAQSGPLPRDWFMIPFLNQASSERVGFNTQKPEELIKKFILVGSNEGDIILDFFAGSGTTLSVAHKLKRKYIGIEQMDYVKDITVPRLHEVVNGIQTGISEEVNWQGGGSFVYAELMEKSKGYLESVLEAEDTDSLKQIYQLMLENVDLDFRVDLEQVQEMLNDGISLEDKKRLLVKVIDKNQLYYNYSEIDDANVRDLISDNDYAFNQSFYKEEEYHGQENQ